VTGQADPNWVNPIAQPLARAEDHGPPAGGARRSRIRVRAVPQEPRGGGGLERPVLQPPPVAGEDTAEEREIDGFGTVYVSRGSLITMTRHAVGSPRDEVGGFLLGRIGRSHRGDFTSVVHALPAIQARGHATALEIPPSAFAMLHAELERTPDLRCVGWYHTHPGLGIFLSHYDQFLHSSWFNGDGQIALVGDHTRYRFGIFTASDGRPVSPNGPQASVDMLRAPRPAKGPSPAPVSSPSARSAGAGAPDAGAPDAGAGAPDAGAPDVGARDDRARDDRARDGRAAGTAEQLPPRRAGTQTSVRPVPGGPNPAEPRTGYRRLLPVPVLRQGNGRRPAVRDSAATYGAPPATGSVPVDQHRGRVRISGPGGPRPARPAPARPAPPGRPPGQVFRTSPDMRAAVLAGLGVVAVLGTFVLVPMLREDHRATGSAQPSGSGDAVVVGPPTGAAAGAGHAACTAEELSAHVDRGDDGRPLLVVESTRHCRLKGVLTVTALRAGAPAADRTPAVRHTVDVEVNGAEHPSKVQLAWGQELGVEDCRDPGRFQITLQPADSADEERIPLTPDCTATGS
jgi:proteasome lid subunit RPN8/RPN11